MPEHPSFVVKTLAVLVETSAFPDMGGYYSNSIFTRLKIQVNVNEDICSYGVARNKVKAKS